MIRTSLLIGCTLFLFTHSYGQQVTNVFPNTGKVGIGTLQPRAFLDVSSTIAEGQLGTVLARLTEGNHEGDGTFLGVRAYTTLLNSATPGKSFALEHSFFGHVNNAINFFRGNDMFGGFITFNTNTNIERMRIDGAGNVLIGTSVSAGEKLAVNGDIRARQIKVETTNWPDYVFSENYQLPSLKETEKFIQTNGHLPEVPKAETVEKEGYSLNEMDKILLKKIEELTLHIIDLDKTNQKQQQLIDKLLLEKK
ncbi:hypothetical protein [Sphingobacterium faecium]